MDQTRRQAEDTGVLQLISTSGFYGAERVLVELAAFLQQEGIPCRVAVLESPGANTLLARAARLGIHGHVLPGPTLPNPPLLRALRRLVAEHRIGLVHSHGYKTDVAARMCILPRSVRRVATCHSWYSDSFKLQLYEGVDKLVLRAFDHVVAVSPQILRSVRRSGVHVERSSLVENGIAVPEASPAFDRRRLRDELQVPPGQPLILRVGRLAPSKGNHLLLRALAEVRVLPWHLVLAGEGEEEEELRALAARLGLAGRVTFAGYRRDVADLLHLADLFVIPSLDEGLPIVLLEAMACGVPVLSSEVGAIGQVLRAEESGWLVPPGRVGPLARALERALTHPEEGRDLAEEARRQFHEQHSRMAMGQRYLQIYGRVGAKLGAMTR